MSEQLSKDWKWVKLENIAEITSSRRIFQNEYVKEGIPFFRTKEIKELNEGREITVELFISNEKYNDIKNNNEIPKVGDILISAVGTIGVSYIIKDEKPFYFKDGNLVWVRKLNGIISKYLHLLFTHYIRFKQQISTSGSAYNALTIIKLKTFEIYLPPLDIQKTIVSKIEELFSELDNGIENLRIAQQQLKVYRQGVLKWAFEGKLTNDNIKEGELPEGWKFVKIESLLSDKKKGMATGPFGTMLKKSEHQKSGVPVLGIENIGQGVFKMPNKIFVTDEKAVELKNFKVKENDIIISRSGTVGEICLLPKQMENSIISTNLIRVSLNLKIINAKYFVYLFQGGKVRQEVFDLCKGSSRAFLNQTILNSLDFPFCSIKEQEQIISEIESRFSVADKMEESITQSLQQAEALRQSILKKAFEGKLV